MKIMKAMFVFFCLLMACLTGCSTNHDTPENPFRLKSSVVVVPDRDISWEYQYVYDDQGQLIQEQQLADGELDITWIYEYDVWGNLLKRTTVHADGTVINTEYNLMLDQEHRIVYQEVFIDGILNETVEMAYDSNGNQIMRSEISINSYGNERCISSEMSYDKNNNLLVKVVQWRDDPSKGGITTYSYEKGRLTREKYVLPDGRVRSYVEYSYDDTGMIQTSQEYENGLPSIKIVTTNDEYGNPLTYKYYLCSKDVPGGGDDIADRMCTYTYEQLETT